MKSLCDPELKQELLQRIQRVQPTRERRRRKMSAHPMTCPLAEGYRLYMGEISAPPVKGSAFAKRIARTAARYMPVHWPSGVIPTLPSIDQVAGCGTSPAQFADNVRVLCELLEQFPRLPRDCVWRQHPGLGALSYPQWMRHSPIFAPNITCVNSAPELAVRSGLSHRGISRILEE